METAPTLNGDYEIVYEEKTQWALPSKGLIEYGDLGVYKCTACGATSNGYGNRYGVKKKPELCPNNACGRKKTMHLVGPEHLQRPIWLLPGKPIKSTPTEIFNSLTSFFRDSLVLRDYEYDILCLWVMSSWLVEDFRTCPYLALIAPKSSGKTQVMEAIHQTAYRAFTTASVTPAALFRAIELWNITLCIDEAQDIINSKTDVGQAIYSCLLSGYKRGMPALRSGDGSNNFIPESFNVFGFKAFSGTKLVLPTLESRSIALEMRKAKPKNILIDEEEATKLRSMLLYYRFSHLTKTQYVMPESDSGRLIELFIPLFSVANGLDCAESLEYTISKMANRDDEEEMQSIEGQIVQAIFDIQAGDDTGTFGEKTMVFYQDIIDHIGWERKPGSNIALGNKLKLLGIPKKHTSIGNGVNLIDPETISALNYLQDRYKIR